MKKTLVEGNIFHNSKFQYGIFNLETGKFVESYSKAPLKGTLIPAPYNFHTHISDSFISDEPKGTIPEIVGPNGFKMRKLESVTEDKLRAGVLRAVEYMKDVGTKGFIDFKETVKNPPNLMAAIDGIEAHFLSRPSNQADIRKLLLNYDGFGMSSISDYPLNWLEELSSKARKAKKIFAIHFSENSREDCDDLLKINPDFIIHAIETDEDDLSTISREEIPVVVTPRSNVFFGKRPDYSRFVKHNIKMMVGTDNVFGTEPNIWEEASFLYRIQRSQGYISPESVISMITENPRHFLSKKGIRADNEKYVLFEDPELSAYQIISKPNFYKTRIITV